MHVCARLCDVREWPHAKSEMRYLFIMEIYTICEYGYEYNCEHSLIITFVLLCFFEHFQYVGISFGAPRDCYRYRYCVRAVCIIHSSGIADTNIFVRVECFAFDRSLSDMQRLHRNNKRNKLCAMLHRRISPMNCK